MKSSRPLPAETSPVRKPKVLHPGWLSAWFSFWFSAAPATGLHILRMICGFLFFLWLLPLAGQQMEIFGLAGLFDRQAYLELSLNSGMAPIAPGWSLVFLCGSSATSLQILFWEGLVIFLLFALGIATRTTSVLTWVLVVSFVASPAAAFDADFLLVMLAFYLMIGYVLLGQWNGEPSMLNRFGFVAGLAAGGALGGILTLAVGLEVGVVVGVASALVVGVVAETIGSGPLLFPPWKASAYARPSYAANLAMRLIQVHFAIVVVTSCLHKFQFGDWWSGVALWYPLHDPFTMTLDKLRAEAQNANTLLFFYSLATYIMLAWQLAFPVFAWRPRWRWLLIGSGVIAWLGSIFIYGVPLFGPVYLIGCLSFLTSAEWGKIDRIMNLMPSADKKEPGRVVKESVRA